MERREREEGKKEIKRNGNEREGLRTTICKALVASALLEAYFSSREPNSTICSQGQKMKS